MASFYSHFVMLHIATKAVINIYIFLCIINIALVAKKSANLNKILNLLKKQIFLFIHLQKKMEDFKIWSENYSFSKDKNMHNIRKNSKCKYNLRRKYKT